MIDKPTNRNFNKKTNMTSFWVKKLRLIKNLIRKGADFAKEKQLIYAFTNTDQLFFFIVYPYDFLLSLPTPFSFCE